MRKLNRQNTDSPPYKPWILNIEYEVEPWSESQRKESHLV